MPIISYKHYLLWLEKRPKLSNWQKTLLTFIGLFLIISGSFSAYFLYQFKKAEPFREEIQYLETANSGFIATNQSLDEILSSFQIAGAKIQAIDQSKEATRPAAVFPVSIDDLAKTVASLENVKKNVVFQKDQLIRILPPSRFKDLNSQLLAYYDETVKVLVDLDREQRFIKEVYLALGPNFYLPVLSDEALWRSGKNEEIITYYQKVKKEADKTLASLYHLTPPENFKSYHAAQIAYLELLVKTADSIINILSQKDDPNLQVATQLEKAYQTLVGAKRENETLEEKLASQRLKFVAPEENLAKFASARIHQNSLSQKFNDIYVSQPQSKTYKLPGFLQKVLKSNFF